MYRVTNEKGTKVAYKVKNVDEYLKLRNSPENLANLIKAREGDQKAKRNLVQFNYTGVFADGAPIKNNSLHSPFFAIDIDDPEEFDRILPIVMADKEKYQLMLAERSVSQGGHLVFPRQKGTTILENQIRMAKILGCEIDTNQHAPNGVFFATSASPEDLPYVSENLFKELSLEEAEQESDILKSRVENREELIPQEARANKHYKPSQATTLSAAKPATVVVSNADEKQDTKGNDDEVKVEELKYNGIPYSTLRDMWWQMYYGGETPNKGNRDTRIYEFCINFRHICGYNAKILDAIIPEYDGFPREQKLKCINQALAAKMTLMPKRMTDLLLAARRNYMSNGEFQDAVDELIEKEDTYYYNKLPKEAMPMGISDAIKAVGPQLAMPAVFVSTACIGALATGVRVKLRKQPQNLNQINFIAGISGSGKGGMDAIYKAWCYDLVKEANEAHEKEKAWRRKREATGTAKDKQPERPEYPVRMISLNNTIPNIATRLENVHGKHCISFTPEADSCLAKWKTSSGEFSSMLRQAYDGSGYSRDARSAEAASVIIDSLLWNVIICGTPDSLYRILNNNYTDGLLSRIAIARTPDNTFSKLSEESYFMTQEHRENIIQIATLLQLMQGEVELPALEKHAMKWVESIREEAIKNNDSVFADARKRDWVTAFRMMVCIMLCRVCEKMIMKYGFEESKTLLKNNPQMWVSMLQKFFAGNLVDKILPAYDVIADYIIENDMYYFRDRLENAYSSNNYNGNVRSRRSKNDSIYDSLDKTFVKEQAYQMTVRIKGSVTENAVRKMLTNWEKQGLVIRNNDNTYTKIAS